MLRRKKRKRLRGSNGGEELFLTITLQTFHPDDFSLEREEEKRRLLNPEEEINEILDFCQETGRSHESDLPLKQRVSTFPLNNM